MHAGPGRHEHDGGLQHRPLQLDAPLQGLAGNTGGLTLHSSVHQDSRVFQISPIQERQQSTKVSESEGGIDIAHGT